MDLLEEIMDLLDDTIDLLEDTIDLLEGPGSAHGLRFHGYLRILKVLRGFSLFFEARVPGPSIWT